jgi:hypothetical protein
LADTSQPSCRHSGVQGHGADLCPNVANVARAYTSRVRRFDPLFLFFAPTTSNCPVCASDICDIARYDRPTLVLVSASPRRPNATESTPPPAFRGGFIFKNVVGIIITMATFPNPVCLPLPAALGFSAAPTNATGALSFREIAAAGHIGAASLPPADPRLLTACLFVAPAAQAGAPSFRDIAAASAPVAWSGSFTTLAGAGSGLEGAPGSMLGAQASHAGVEG